MFNWLKNLFKEKKEPLEEVKEAEIVDPNQITEDEDIEEQGQHNEEEQKN